MATASSDQDHPQSTPCACLDSVPTEVKSRIAELCWLQDKWWHKYNEHMHKQFAYEADDSDEESEYSPFLSLHDEIAKRYGQSLSQLALLSRGWADVTAPFRFQTVKVSRSGRPVFRQRIALRHAHHVRKIDFDELDMSQFSVFLSYLRGFINVKNVVVGTPEIAEFCRKAMVEENPYRMDEAQLMASSQLRQMFGQLESLRYACPPPHLLPTFQLAASTLTSFGMRIAEAATDMGILSQVLKSARRLRTLSLDAADCEPDFTNLPPLSEMTWPALTRMSFKAKRINPSFAGFLLDHQTSTQSLSLEWTEEPFEDDNPTFTFPPSSSFPLLYSLELLEGGVSALFPLLASIKHSTLPVLRLLTVVPKYSNLDDPGTQVETSTHLNAILERYNGQGPAVYSYESSSPLCAYELYAHHLKLTYGRGQLVRTPVTPYPHTAFHDPDPDDFDLLKGLDLLKQPMANTMDFLASWYQRVKASGSAQDYSHLAYALQLVELERVAQTA
ncbi:hypothetical protein NBRC10513v2_003233 [Rhodotorula toruloides]|uniref:Proteophosphoglycan ppg4 n=1 Tax=Rhodotorula toruloides TaxID=5286 RepID=A0A2T0ABI7_RHOTO|nr:hypothetical protein AAT19DRAFT_14400 [Rhodotorula toruloides]